MKRRVSVSLVVLLLLAAAVMGTTYMMERRADSAYRNLERQSNLYYSIAFAMHRVDQLENRMNQLLERGTPIPHQYRLGEPGWSPRTVASSLTLPGAGSAVYLIESALGRRTPSTQRIRRLADDQHRTIVDLLRKTVPSASELPSGQAPLTVHVASPKIDELAERERKLASELRSELGQQCWGTYGYPGEELNQPPMPPLQARGDCWRHFFNANDDADDGGMFFVFSSVAALALALLGAIGALRTTATVKD